MDDLKFCPFCGGPAEVVPFLHGERFFKVECGVCLCETDGYLTEEAAVRAWNKRPKFWISVADRLPDKFGFYLVSVKSGYKPYTTTLKYDTHEKQWMNPLDLEITHWAPMPEAAL